MIDIKRDFSGYGENICLLMTGVLLPAAAVELEKSKKPRDLTPRNTALLPTFLTKIVLADRENVEEAILKTLVERINKQEADNSTEESDDDEESQSDEHNDKERAKKLSTKDAAARDAIDRILSYWDDVHAFLQAVDLKAPRVLAAPLSLQADKRATSWFC